MSLEHLSVSAGDYMKRKATGSVLWLTRWALFVLLVLALYAAFQLAFRGLFAIPFERLSESFNEALVVIRELDVEWLRLHDVSVGAAVLTLIAAWFLRRAPLSRPAEEVFGFAAGGGDMKRFLRATVETLAQGIIALLVTFGTYAALAFANPPEDLLTGVLYTAGSLLLGALAFLIAGAFFVEESSFVRGARLSSFFAVQFWSYRATRKDPNRFFWAGLWLPGFVGPRGLAAIGMPGSGKTVTIRLFLQSVVPRIFTRPNQRMLLLDAKQDALPTLAGMDIDTRPEAKAVRVLHPYDKRAWVWDMAADFGGDDKLIDELTVLLIPPTKDGKDAFWQEASRELLTGIILSWGMQGKHWTLRDLLAAMLSLDRIGRILKSTPSTQYILEKVLSEKAETTSKNIELSLWTNVRRFMPVAKAWHEIRLRHPERTFSLTEWMTSRQGSILVLGTGAHGTAVDALAQAIVKRIGQIVQFRLSDSPDDEYRTWIVLDELRVVGRLDVATIEEFGRSRGVGVVIGFQDKSGMNEEYTKDIADEMLGACQTKAIFGLATPETADWASRQINTQEVQRVEQGRKIKEERQVIMPSELMSRDAFPMPDPTGRVGITVAAKSAAFGAYKTYFPPKWYRRRLKPLDRTVPGVEHIEERIREFPDWNDDEENYFCGGVSPKPDVDPDVPPEAQRLADLVEDEAEEGGSHGTERGPDSDGAKSRRETLRERLAKRSAARRAGADGKARDIRARFNQRFGDVDLGRKE